MALTLQPAQFRRVNDYVGSASAVISVGAVAATTTNVSNTITVTGAALGDFVEVSANAALGAVTIQGEVTAANTVTLKVANCTAGGITPPASTTFTAVVYRRTGEALA